MQLSRRQFSGWLTAACLAPHWSPMETFGAEKFRPDGPTAMTQANNAFAFTLLRRLTAVKPSDNQFLSPFSLESALAIAMEGARGATAEQMGQCLQFPATLKLKGDAAWDMARFRSDYAEMISSLKPPADDAAAQSRKKVADLRQELASLNAKAKQLNTTTKFSEAEKVSTQARKVADRINELSRTFDQYELATANSLWVDKSYPLAKSYQQTIQKFYGSAEANACDFVRQASQERVRINAWVSQNTRDRIKDIIPAGVLSPETRLVIANAIYFKGNWTKPFDTARTASAAFARGDGSTAEVNMMYAPALDVVRYAAFESDGSLFSTPDMVDQNFDPTQGYPGEHGYQALQLPYLGDRLSMIVILPRRADGLNKLLESFSAEKWEACRSALANRPVHVKLPRFKLETTYNLIPDLKSLGMLDAFSPEVADFGGLTQSPSLEERLYISLVIHKAFVEVNEKGTEAAAATIVGMARAMAPVRRPFVPEFTANHPFLSAIVDTQTGAILFIGKVESP